MSWPSSRGVTRTEAIERLLVYALKHLALVQKGAPAAGGAERQEKAQVAGPWPRGSAPGVQGRARLDDGHGAVHFGGRRGVGGDGGWAWGAVSRGYRSTRASDG